MKDVKNVYKFNTLEFLNAGLDEIYCKGKHCVSEKDLLYLKETMAAIILRFERMCRYTYYSDIYIFQKSVTVVYSENNFRLYMSDSTTKVLLRIIKVMMGLHTI